MFRALIFIVFIGGLTSVAVWLADNPGSVTVYWQGYRLDTSVAVLLGTVAAISLLSAVVYRFWLFLRRSPSNINRAWRESRRRRGYLALTRGMVAVAAGDGEESRRQSKRAEVLLEDPPLTMLLLAQSAQLAGDEKAAGKFFKSMRDQAETEFLGLRGLLSQEIKKRNWQEALQLASRAYVLRPKSRWVATNLFDLQTRTAHWQDALCTLNEAVNNRLISPTDGIRHRAVIEHQISIDLGNNANASGALKHAHKAHDLDAKFIPATLRVAQLLVNAGKMRKASKIVSDAWLRQPHPDMLDIYCQSRKASDTMAKLRATQNLVRYNPNHIESRIAIAQISLKAKLWGETRKYLEDIAKDSTSARACRIMAEVEELENGDLSLSREWLIRASRANPDPAWVCGHCGNVADRWSAFCGKCEQFDAFSWGFPSHVPSLMARANPEQIESTCDDEFA